MHLTATTPLAFFLCLAILVLGPARGLVLVFATLPLGSAAAVNLSGLGSIFIAEIAMLTLLTTVILRRPGIGDALALLSPRAAGLPLLFLVVTAGIGAVFLPRLNAGLTDVFTIVRQADGATIALRPLQPTSTNIGQYFRFLLSGLAFVAAALTVMRYATAASVRAAFVAASCVHIGLSALDLLAPVLGVNFLGMFRNAYVAILDDQVLLGLRRLIGGFPEPSAYGIYTIGLYGYWLRMWFGAPRSALAFVMLIVMMALLIRSTSTAAYFGLVVYTVLFLLWKLRSLARDSDAVVLYAVLTFLMPVLVGTLTVIYQFVPALSDFMNTIVFDKLSSASGGERMSWNLAALDNFVDTYGMGAGIGSVRASGWPFAVLGSIGLVGGGFYLWFLVGVFGVRWRGLRQNTQMRLTLSSVQSGALAVFLLSFTILPQPNLGLAFFLSAGVVTGLHLLQRRSAGMAQPIWPRHTAQFRTIRVPGHERA